METCEIIYISDMDSQSMNKCIDAVEKIQNKRPKAVADFKIYDLKNNLLKDVKNDITIDAYGRPAEGLGCVAYSKLF